MIYCIPLDTATEEFYASVARAAGLPMEQVLRDAHRHIYAVAAEDRCALYKRWYSV